MSASLPKLDDLISQISDLVAQGRAQVRQSVNQVVRVVYQAFPIRETLYLELSWSHDTKLIKSIAVLAFLSNWNAVRTELGCIYFSKIKTR